MEEAQINIKKDNSKEIEFLRKEYNGRIGQVESKAK